MKCRFRTDTQKRWRFWSRCHVIECRAVSPEIFPHVTETGASYLFQMAAWSAIHYGQKRAWDVRPPTETRTFGQLAAGPLETADHLEVRSRFCNASCPLFSNNE